jgi:hypothetical protein
VIGRDGCQAVWRSTHLQPADWQVGDPEAAGPVASNLFGASVVSTGAVLWQDQGKSLQSLVSTQESKSGRAIHQF